MLGRSPGTQPVFLTLLLDVLKALEEPNSASRSASKSNPSAKLLQELIEILSSDITEVGGSGFKTEGGAKDASSIPLNLI